MVVLLWVGFVALILAALAVDLLLVHRHPQKVTIRSALLWAGVWVSLALAFNVLIYFLYEYHLFGVGQHIGHDVGGWRAAIDFFTGYVIEESLSLDNIFVIAVIFAYFQVPVEHQRRVLFWGILGAMMLRGLMIGLGVVLISTFAWMTYVFGVLLLATALKMLLGGEEQVDPGRNWLARLCRRVFPITETFEGEHFFARLDGRLAITPLFLVLVVIESMDVLFAVDSIPAIFGVTTDPFLVFTSNIFAILGLRSLYFALAGMMAKFRYLKYSLVAVLAFVGVKMLIEPWYDMHTLISLAVIAVLLTVGVVASLRADRVQGPG